MRHELGDKARNLGKGTGTSRDVQESGQKQELGKGYRNKVCTIAYYQTVSLLLLVSSCKLQSWTKVWDTFVFLGIFQFTQVQPLPSPHKHCWTCVSRIFSEFQLCIVWGEENCKKISKRCTVVRGNQEMTEKYEYCSTVTRTWIAVIGSVKVSIFFCHILNIFYYQYTCKTCIIMKSQLILNLILTVR